MAIDQVKLLPDIDYEFIMSTETRFDWGAYDFFFKMDYALVLMVLIAAGSNKPGSFPFWLIVFIVYNAVLFYLVFCKPLANRLGFKGNRIYYNTGFYEVSEIESVTCGKHEIYKIYVDGKVVLKFNNKWRNFERFAPWAERNGIFVEYEN